MFEDLPSVASKHMTIQREGPGSSGSITLLAIATSSAEKGDEGLLIAIGPQFRRLVTIPYYEASR